MNAPRFWSSLNLIAILLAPLGFIYGLIVRARFALAKSHHAGLPVICVGNFTLGGTGKTPATIYIAERLKHFGETPFILSRGYGGRIKFAHRVDVARDTSEDVGDEALLLARTAPVIVGANRIASAQLALAQGASVLLLDDGMQNPLLHKNLTLALVDGQRGIGNGLTFPAGPLRAQLGWQKKLADATIIIGKDAQFVPQNADWLKDKCVLAFCGIGNPEKFRVTLQQLGAEIVHFESYPDHYAYDARDANYLIERAAKDDLTLVTTEKDLVRLQGYPETRAQLAGLVNAVAIKFVPNDAEQFDAMLRRACESARGA